MKAELVRTQKNGKQIYRLTYTVSEFVKVDRNFVDVDGEKDVTLEHVGYDKHEPTIQEKFAAIEK